MCVIIDTDTINKVLETKNADHKKFVPIYNYLKESRTNNIVIGGTRFTEEIKNATKNLSMNARQLYSLLKSANRIMSLKDKKIQIDTEEQRLIETIPPHRDFDDPHIFALVKVSGVKLVCTSETRMPNWIRNNKRYFPRCTPKFYRSQANKGMLTRENLIKYGCRCCT